jgi:hypothetical protein
MLVPLKQTKNVNLQLTLLHRLHRKEEIDVQKKKGLHIYCNFNDIESRELSMDDIMKPINLTSWER